VGENDQAVIRPSFHFLRRSLTMIGSTYFEIGHYYAVVRVLQRVKTAENLITHRFPLLEAAQAFATFKAGATGKVVLLGN